MSDFQNIHNDFLQKINAVIENNLSDEQFGVSELAKEINMSRSNLLRKVKKITNVSVSQYIRELRLKNSLDLLKDADLTVSEVSYRVGFSSTSYFIKCFHEYYGYTPGEAVNRESEQGDYIPMGSHGQSHKLAAIMFTDIEGYTAMMQKNEEEALAYIHRHREVFNKLTSKHKGRILQYYGDGTLSTFNSAIDAVNCGIEMQLAFREKPTIPVRIGIHSGDIIFGKNGVIGDGVNVASRIESLAVPGSVFISEKVYDEVKNQPGIHTVSLGKFEFKNVDKPIEVFVIINPGLAVPKRDQVTGKLKQKPLQNKKRTDQKTGIASLWWVLVPLGVMILGLLVYNSGIFKNKENPTTNIDPAYVSKSIAVLPFINDSGDSSNVYIINGLMEAILNNLQKIENLRVISRTSVEKYRDTDKLIPEIGRELNVRYFVEGSGQKIGDQILLNIQLIEATNDRHLWSQRYERQVIDIFNLQIEIAKNIADEIEVIIKPEEEARISSSPTDDLIAYDYFLKGQNEIFKGTREGLKESIPWFMEAIKRDPEFAYAHADMAIAYYYLDALQAEKQYIDSIEIHADKALLYDHQLPQSLVAKALYFINIGDYPSSLPYLETALEYHPNSSMIINLLSDFYTSYMPNTEKYLEYALKGAQLDIGSQDSTDASFTYLHISNALAQNGFVEEADGCLGKSLEYNPSNLFSMNLKAYIVYAKTGDLKMARNVLLKALAQDTTRVDLIQEIGKICFYQRDYQSAFTYYQKYLEIKNTYNLNIFPGENAKIGLVFSEMGLNEEAERLFNEYREYADDDNTMYKHLSLSVFYAYHGKVKDAVDHLRMFAQKENYPYWITLLLKIDPLMDNIIHLPETKEILSEMELKFWSRHEKLKKRLEGEGVL